MTTGPVSTIPDPGPATPAPYFKVTFAVLEHQCAHHAHGERAKTRARCALRPVSAHGRVLRLGSRQTGQLTGRLLLAGQPIAGAQVTLEWAIPHWQAQTETLETGPQGQISAPIQGPDKQITLIYNAGSGVYAAVTEKVVQGARLSLHADPLRAGRVARFNGVLDAVDIPQNQYVQLWYQAGGGGWQPFAQLARVDPKTGAWAARVPIPAASAGFTYRVRATAVKSPLLPWAESASNTTTCKVNGRHAAAHRAARNPRHTHHSRSRTAGQAGRGVGR